MIWQSAWEPRNVRVAAGVSQTRSTTGGNRPGEFHPVPSLNRSASLMPRRSRGEASGRHASLHTLRELT